MCRLDFDMAEIARSRASTLDFLRDALGIGALQNCDLPSSSLQRDAVTSKGAQKKPPAFPPGAGSDA